MITPFDLWLGAELAEQRRLGHLSTNYVKLLKLAQAYRKAWTYGMLKAPQLRMGVAKEIAQLEMALMRTNPASERDSQP